jgi:hypothetical protein
MIGHSKQLLIHMGSPKDVMELFAERDIHQLFSVFDKWSISPVPASRSPGFYYRASKSLWEGNEIALIGVSFDPESLEESVLALDTLADDQGKRIKKYLLVPQATNTSEVPPHVRVLHMTEFSYVGDNLVWLTNKKNAKKISPPEHPVAA